MRMWEYYNYSRDILNKGAIIFIRYLVYQQIRSYLYIICNIHMQILTQQKDVFCMSHI